MTNGFNVLENSLDDRCVIEASAGTGKTWTLTRVVLRLVVEKGIPLPRILLVTFTRAATAEMRDRIRGLLADALHAWRCGEKTDEWTPFFTRWRQLDLTSEVENRLVAALEAFDQAAIYTIHGFCRQMLAEGTAVSDRTLAPADALIEQTTDEFLRYELLHLPGMDSKTEKSVRERLVTGDWQTLLKRLAARSAESPEVVKLCTGNDSVGLVMAGIVGRWVNWGPKRLRELKKAAGLMTEDDLLTMMDESLKCSDFRRRTANRFDAVLIDEFQDTNDIQYRIFKTLFWTEDSRKFVLLVGDPKQAIYRFRAADPMIYSEAVKEIRHTEKLLTNYRSHPALVRGINAFFTQVKYPFLTNRIEFKEGDGGKKLQPLLRQGKDLPVFEVWHATADCKGSAADAKEKEIKCTAQEIAEHLDGTTRIDGRILQPSDIAVLVPTWGDAEEMVSALREKGVTCKTVGERNRTCTSVAQDLLTLLKAVQLPEEAGRVKSAQVTPLLGRTLSEAVADLNVRSRDVDFLRNLSQAFNATGLAGVLASFFNDPVRLQGIRLQAGFDYLSDFRMLGLQLHKKFGQRASLSGVIRYLQRQIKEPSDEEMTVVPVVDNAVTVQTLHSSKGLEYPVVYVLGTMRLKACKPGCEMHWHDEKTNQLCISDNELVLPSEASDWFYEAETSEKARLLYVGMTRATHRLVLPLLYGQRKPAKSTPFQVLSGQLDVKGACYEALLDRLAKSLSDILEQRCKVVRKSLNETTTEAPLKQTVSTAVAASAPLLSGRHASSFSSLIRRRITAQQEEKSSEFSEEETVTIDEKAPTMAGAEVGLFLHEVMEHLDFAEPSENGAVIAAAMEHHRHLFDSDDTVREWQRYVETMAETVTEMPLAENLRLKDVRHSQRSAEWPFTLAVGQKGVSTRASELVRLLRSFGAQYDVGEMTDTALEGYLTGTADLVFEHEGRFYLVDWKSNLIGQGTSEDYTDSAMEAEMRRHGYRLQYLLYLVALTRFVATRGGMRFNEAYEKVGGVFYVFLRGINRDGTRGIVRERPPLELMTALDAFFKGAAVH